MNKGELTFEEYISLDLPTKKPLLKLFTREAPIVIFDIGACEGEDSIRYSLLFQKSNIYSFEPVAENIQKIKTNLAKYNTKNINLVEKALSDKAGQQTMHLSSGQPDNNSGKVDHGNKSSSILKPGYETSKSLPWLKFDRERVIDCDSLAGFMQTNNINNIDFIHMDVQGAELMVLKGAGKKIENIKSVWLEVANIEFYEGQPLTSDIDAFMKDNGFVLFLDRAKYKQYGDRMYVNTRFFPKSKLITYNMIDSAQMEFLRYKLMLTVGLKRLFKK